MEDTKKQWIYFEPYTFIFKGREEAVVYNSVNGSYFLYKNHHIINILNKLLVPENGYCVPIDQKIAKNKEVIKFIISIKQSFSGNVIRKDFSNNNKPFIFMPILRLYNNIDRIKNERGQSLGEVILRNLSEVTIFLSGQCEKGCSSCVHYYKQFIHCTSGIEGTLSFQEYNRLFGNLEASGVSQINLVINGGVSCDFLKELSRQLIDYSFKTTYHMNVEHLDKYLSIITYDKDVSINIFIHPHATPNIWKDIKSDKYKQFPITWQYIISDIEDVNSTSIYEIQNLSIIPFYNGINDDFFENNVYITKDELLEKAISKQQIFRRQVLNENFFGKLYILPSGEVFSNLNMDPLGNICKQSLGEIVYHEFNKPQAWLKTRDNSICKECVNKYLCPSISNYELVAGKMNMCKIHSKQQ